MKRRLAAVLAIAALAAAGYWSHLQPPRIGPYTLIDDAPWCAFDLYAPQEGDWRAVCRYLSKEHCQLAVAMDQQPGEYRLCAENPTKKN